MSNQPKITSKLFFNKVLSGTTLGIIIGLMPNAVLGSILKYFPQTNFVILLSQTVVPISISYSTINRCANCPTV